jgi:hypothetical protein
LVCDNFTLVILPACPTKTFYILGAIHNIVNINCKKRSEAESAFFDFRVKKISAYGVDDDILEEIQKFPFPFQQLITKRPVL